MDEKPVSYNDGRGFHHYRYVVSLMCALGTMNVYSLRNAINVAMVVMADKNNLNWDKGVQGIIMSSYYWGYIGMNLIGAWCAKRFGVRRVFGICGLIGSTLTLFMPLMCKAGVSYTIALRIVLGLFGGVSFPVVYTTCGLWAPGSERSRHLAMGFSGTSTGNFIVFPLVGLIIDGLGWEAVFYCTGAFGICWSVAWVILIRDTPEEHPWVSQEEKDLIKAGAPKVEPEKEEDKGSVPWLSIFTSMPFWALVIPHMCENYLSGTTVSWFPSYMKNNLQFDIKAAAALASLPFLMKFIVQLGSAFLADFIISKGWWGKTIRVRQVFTTIAFLSPFIAYVFVGCWNFISPDYSIPIPLAIFCLIVGESFLSFNYPGYRTCLVDIAPKYCGILYGISNTLASAAMSLGPLIAGQILMAGQKEPSIDTVSDFNSTSTGAPLNFTTVATEVDFKANASEAAWSTFFIVCSCMVLVGLSVFLIFGTNEEQEWAKPKTSPDSEKDEKEKEELISASKV